MKAMLNVLQDDGYVVKNAAVTDLGLITATHESDLAPGRSGGGDVRAARRHHHPLAEAAAVGASVRRRRSRAIARPSRSSSPATSREFGEQTKVRVSFSAILDNRGEMLKSNPSTTATSARTSSRMDKGLFLRKENL